MNFLSGRRPTPAMVVAVLALAFAVVGTAMAGVATISVLGKQEKKQVKKIARKQANAQITARARGLSVSHATTADSANSAATANSATSANSATTGAAAAYAAVNANGSLTEGYAAKNIDEGDVTNPATGSYCFELPFTPKTAAANAQATGDEDGILSVDLVSPFTDCPKDAEAEVRNFDSSEILDQNDTFMVQFDN